MVYLWCKCRAYSQRISGFLTLPSRWAVAVVWWVVSNVAIDAQIFISSNSGRIGFLSLITVWPDPRPFLNHCHLMFFSPSHHLSRPSCLQSNIRWRRQGQPACMFSQLFRFTSTNITYLLMQEDSIHLWREVCSNTLLANASIILFINKMDILRQTLSAGLRVADYVPSYGDAPNDAQNVTNCRTDPPSRSILY